MAVETKVQAATSLTLLASMAVSVLNAVTNDSHLLGSLPPLAQFVILTCAPTLLTFLGGYVSPHSPRPDLYNYGPPLEPYLPQPPPSLDPLPEPLPPLEPHAPTAYGYEEEPEPVFREARYERETGWQQSTGPLMAPQRQWDDSRPSGRHQAPPQPVRRGSSWEPETPIGDIRRQPGR